MSNDPNQPFSQSSPASMGSLESQQAEQARRQINQIAEEIAQLAEMDVAPAQFYGEFLQRVYFAVQGFAAAVWLRTPQGNLLLQCQINLREVALDRSPDSKSMHDELLRQAATQAKGGIIRPHFSHNFGNAPDQLAGNPTDFTILLIPILQEKQVIGLLEIWQDPARPSNMLQNVYQFMLRMAAFVSTYTRNHQLRQMLGQQELWLRLETFARQIHGSLHEREVAYIVANEGRRLVEADRISVATCASAKCVVTAISGADVVERRSNLVQLMRALFDAVIDWNEKLIYSGVKDDALPPRVLNALDAYLGESNSKLLVIIPLQDEREKEPKRNARSALMMECFETNLQPEQLIARLDVVGRHAAPALYNALEYRRIPMRFIWLPLAFIQDGLGGKVKAITTAVILGLILFVLAMVFVPFPLKMEAPGEVLPRVRGWVYSPIPGKIDDIPAGLNSGSKVAKGQILFHMSDVDLAKQIYDLQSEIASLEFKTKSQVARINDPNSKEGVDPIALKEAEITRRNKIELLHRLQQRTNASLNKPGFFTIPSPRAGIILSADFRENLVGKAVKPSEQLLRIGYTDVNNPKLSDWEIQLKIPQKHFGQVLAAYERIGADKELDVDVLFKSEPTGAYRAKLHKSRIASQANMQKDDNNEPEPVILAWARVESKYQLTDKAFTALRSAKVDEGVLAKISGVTGEFESRELFLGELARKLDAKELARYQTQFLRQASAADIPLDKQITPALLLSNSEVSSRIRCGDRAMGYSLFYGVWEFVHEKIYWPYLR